MKSKVAADMSSPAGEIRLLLATQAYGMGVDAKHIRRIVHAGSPTTLEGILYLPFDFTLKYILHYEKEIVTLFFSALEHMTKASAVICVEPLIAFGSRIIVMVLISY